MTFIPSVMCSGSAGVLIMLARTLVPSQSTTAATNGTGMPGRGEGDDGERAHLALGGDLDGVEVGAAAVGAGVAPVEVAGAACVALVGHEVRLVTEDEVVDERDLRGGHRHGSLPSGWLCAEVVVGVDRAPSSGARR